jgi:ferrous iron transport protein B
LEVFSCPLLDWVVLLLSCELEMENSLKSYSKNSADSQRAVVALVGNMSVGKSTLFSRICKKEVKSVSIPGLSPTFLKGPVSGEDVELLGTPGVFSLFSSNEDERASRDILLKKKEIGTVTGLILVADAKNMKRSLAIALQYAEYGLPMMLAVNMVDEAASRGVEIDYGRLSEIFGVSVCKTVAREGIGIDKIIAGLKTMVSAKRLVEYPDWVEGFLKRVRYELPDCDISSRALGLLVLAEDQGIEEFIGKEFGEEKLNSIKQLARDFKPVSTESFGVLVGHIYNRRAEQIVREIQEVEPRPGNTFLLSFGDFCTQLSTGIPIAIGVVVAMYFFVGSFAATFLVDSINGLIFEERLIPFFTKLLEPLPSAFLRDMIMDPDFGILPAGVFLALGLVMPVLFCFYIAFGILEDSGYLPRFSILLDRVFQKMGLNGRGVIPLVMGFSCVTMAILTTRMLGTKKERNIATFLLLLGVPCAPLVAVMLIILEKMPFSATLTVFGFIFCQMFIAGYVLNKILPGARSPFLLEIPPLRRPKIRQVVSKATMKTYFFMKEAVPVFIYASIFVFLFHRFGGLEWLERMVSPLITKLMGLPEKSVQVFMKTLIRRESGAAELEHLSSSYTNLQLVVNLLVMTFLTPCMNAVIVLFKERGVRTATIIMTSVLIYAITAGSLLNHICRILGVTFT